MHYITVLNHIITTFKTLAHDPLAVCDLFPLAVDWIIVSSLIGLVGYHFASGEIGARILGEPLFSASAVRRRKREVVAFIREGLRAPQDGKRTVQEESS